MDATWSRRDSGREWDAAVDLAGHVAAGGGLPNLASPVLLYPGEPLHADVDAQGWRYCAADVSYTEPHAVGIGGPVMFGLVAAGAVVARRRARRDAAALAAPQWRPLGSLRILATDRRLLVWHDAAWVSVWYYAIRELHPQPQHRRLDMVFDNDPPYCLAGPWVPCLAVVVTTCLADRLGIEPVGFALQASSGAQPLTIQTSLIRSK